MNKFSWAVLTVSMSVAICAPAAGPQLDASPDRARTPVDPGLKQIGTIRPRSAHEITGSNWTLGCETLDRDFADYQQYKDYLVPLGIKTIRLQAGWAKTERVKGQYDFSWLDTIIDDARSRGLNILLETDYGNTNYAGGGGWDLAGGFPTSDEALAAWDRWVEAMATRYKGKVRDWAMWNEPDINKQHKPEDIAVFNIRTTEIIRRVIPEARIAGLSLASSSPKLLEDCLKALAARGKVDLFDWFIYHGYAFNPDNSYPKVEALKATLAKYSPKAKMRQGENGCPSEKATKFALSNHPWTESSQAKWDLRRMLGDLGHDVESAVFTICDFNHTGREINRKGLLRATADKKVEKIKLAYYAVQNCVAVFDDTLERVQNPALNVTFDKRTASFAYRKKGTGQSLLVLWDNSATPGDSFATRPAQVQVKGLSFRDPVWVDLVSGRIYQIPSDRISTSGDTTQFKDIPVYDSPVLIAEQALLSAEALVSGRSLWRDANVNARIDAGIEKHRKGDATIEVRNAAGQPVKNARVTVRQTGHEFLFGCNAFVLGQLKPDELERRYESAFTNLFNFATVPFYWEGTEPTRGELRYAEPARDIWRRPPPDRFIPWAATNNITLKGHPLLWHAYNPPWLPKDAAELRALYQKRFREIANRFGDKIPIWDVVNESLVCSTNYPLFTRDRAYVAWAFAEAVPLFPRDRLMMINEVTSFNFPPAEKNPYFAQVRSLLAQGTPIRGIGLQFHFFRREALDKHLASGNCDPAKLLDLYERFAEFKLPLYITEITIPSAGEGGDALQAEVVRDYYRLWFSAPTMAGITWWNLGDGTAVKGENEAKGGLMDAELQPKPAYRALDQLINQEWKTKAQLETDAQGQAKFRGFFGKYEVEVRSGDKARRFEINHTCQGPQSHQLPLAP